MEIGDTNTASAQSEGGGDGDNAALRPGAGLVARSLLVRTLLRNWRGALDIILPPLCLGCQIRLADHNALCAECWRGIDFIRPPLCDRLGIPLPYDIGGPMLSAAAAAHPREFDRARAVARYDGLMRHLIHDLKFHDSHNARHLFGKWLHHAGADLISDAEAIVPVPLTRVRLLWRRFNQAQVLASEIAHLTGKPLLPLALQRTRETAHQIGLSRLQRQRNVAGAFKVSHGSQAQIAGKSILLVDDVMTTGATASAASKALKAAGAERVDVLVLALVTDMAA